MKRCLGFFIIFGLLLTLTPPLPVSAQETVYYFPTTEWRTSTPEAQGMDSVLLAQFLTRMSALPDAFHSIVLIRHGDVVLDTSTYPFHSSEPQAFRDSAEAVMATLIGIAIDQGFIQSVDQSIWDFLPKDQTTNMDADKEALTIEDFLTHRSGLTFIADPDFQKYYPMSGIDEDWVQFLLDGTMAKKPGTDPAVWRYGDGLVLSAILQQATGMTALDFAQQNLFGPLGISEVTWLADPQGITIGYDELYLSPMDMAKIAYLYLRNGQWAGQQIVSHRWVETATSPIAIWLPAYDLDAFGYGWIVTGEGRNRFFGQMTPGGEQFGVFPELDLVYMVTGDTYFQLDSNFSSTLLPSIGESPTLPENPEAFASLNAKVESLAAPVPRDVAALPEAFQAASGRTFTLSQNKLGWETLSVDFGAPGSNEATLALGISGSVVSLTVGLDMVNRVTPVGLPAQPDSGAYRLYGDMPWMAKANLLAQDMYIYMGDSLGRESWMLRLSFTGEGRLQGSASLRGLSSPADAWYLGGTAD